MQTQGFLRGGRAVGESRNRGFVSVEGENQSRGMRFEAGVVGIEGGAQDGDAIVVQTQGLL